MSSFIIHNRYHRKMGDTTGCCHSFQMGFKERVYWNLLTSLSDKVGVYEIIFVEMTYWNILWVLDIDIIVMIILFPNIFVIGLTDTCCIQIGY